MGRALARQMAERGDSLFVLGRSAPELERTLSDLAVRGGRSMAGCAECDLARPDTFGPALDAAAAAHGGAFDCVVVTAGVPLRSALPRTIGSRSLRTARGHR